MIHTLLIEDDITFCLMLKTWLKKKGIQTESASTISSAKNMIERNSYDLILSDLRLPDGSGMDVLEWSHSKKKEIPFIMLTGYADIQTAVDSIKKGAFDYIPKPINPDILLEKIQEALSTKKEAEVPVSINYIKGNSALSKKLYEYVDIVAPTEMSILITGESGTGKEHIANLIHSKSARKSAPFIAVDCGTIPKELAASEFFGHTKGSFTGAIENKTGYFTMANGGTLFLDEIANLSAETQMQLLRALQEKKIRPVGSNDDIRVDVRIIAATNENLSETVGVKFRDDLYHRLNEFSIQVPSLRERDEDIVLFSNYFLNEGNQEFKKDVVGFTDEAMEIIQKYHWPGNLREMKNVIKRSVLLTTEQYISADILPQELKNKKSEEINSNALHDEEFEKSQILKALEMCNNNKSQAALLLKIDRKTLYNKLKLYNMNL
ncbi:MAG: sigma-54 dependent transcriptional regulator [Paludibacteraceae bacterium]|nr:sigma-54-dependent Fis family transcriptional regulator [Paludibacteraceae bacterium]MEE0912588.1 sigma-54 dependent transcriptional regulator [Paludibacteraceae bacterium]